jgi:hypothetical protein
VNTQTISLKMLHTLQQGKNRLSDEAQKRISSFVRSQMTENGAFVDKNGNADLYYTSFGLMLTYIFNLNINNKWLDEQEKKTADLVNYSALVRSRLLGKLQLSGKLNFALKRLFTTKQKLPDFTDYPHSDQFSPYSQFLLLSLKEDLGIGNINRQEVLSSLSAYRVENGGYSNVKESKTASINATVAALAVKGQLCGYQKNDDVDYLYSSQDESGGFYANASAPIPDLLSTATALFMLKCYGVAPRINPDNFIDAHWQPSGGFCATLMDENCDVEYSFYGLLALGAIR